MKGIEKVYIRVNKLLKSENADANYIPKYYNEDVFEDRMKAQHGVEILKKVIEIIEEEFPNIKNVE